MKRLLQILLFTIVLSGCATTSQRVLDMGDETQLQKRSYQSRIFETADKKQVLRATISTLQDLGFVIDRADLLLGSVSGTKLDGSQVKITVSVRPKGEDRMIVRANAQFNERPIEEPKHYQNFFASLEKSLFLAANAGE
jgi:outer membrane PBP1 activator LpoA protein